MKNIMLTLLVFSSSCLAMNEQKIKLNIDTRQKSPEEAMQYFSDMGKSIGAFMARETPNYEGTSWFPKPEPAKGWFDYDMSLVSWIVTKSIQGVASAGTALAGINQVRTQGAKLYEDVQNGKFIPLDEKAKEEERKRQEQKRIEEQRAKEALEKMNNLSLVQLKVLAMSEGHENSFFKNMLKEKYPHEYNAKFCPAPADMTGATFNPLVPQLSGITALN